MLLSQPINKQRAEMEETKEKKIVAAQARAMAHDAQQKSMPRVMELIESRAKQGFTEAALFMENINLEGVQTLIKMGYSVSTIKHHIDESLVYKISWE